MCFLIKPFLLPCEGHPATWQLRHRDATSANSPSNSILTISFVYCSFLLQTCYCCRCKSFVLLLFQKYYIKKWFNNKKIYQENKWLAFSLWYKMRMTHDSRNMLCIVNHGKITKPDRRQYLHKHAVCHAEEGVSHHSNMFLTRPTGLFYMVMTK